MMWTVKYQFRSHNVFFLLHLNQEQCSEKVQESVNFAGVPDYQNTVESAISGLTSVYMWYMSLVGRHGSVVVCATYKQEIAGSILSCAEYAPTTLCS